MAYINLFVELEELAVLCEELDDATGPSVATGKN